MGVGQLQEVVPVLLVEAGHGGEEEDVLPVAQRVAGDGDIVEVVVGNGRRLWFPSSGRLAEWRGGW